MCVIALAPTVSSVGKNMCTGWFIVLRQRDGDCSFVQRKAHGHAQALVFAFAQPLTRPFSPSADMRPPVRLAHGKCNPFSVRCHDRTVDLDRARGQAGHLDPQPSDMLQQKKELMVEPADILPHLGGCLRVPERQTDRGRVSVPQETRDHRRLTAACGISRSGQRSSYSGAIGQKRFRVRLAEMEGKRPREISGCSVTSRTEMNSFAVLF